MEGGFMKIKGKQFSKILVAIDGSEQSMKAAEYAISIAKRHNSELIGLSVIDISKPRHITSTFITAPISPLTELEQERKEFKQWLYEISNLTKAAGIDLKSEIRESISVVGTIVDYADSENVDLIVTGTRGKSGLKKLLLGSIASGVVTYATCPVMVIK